MSLIPRNTEMFPKCERFPLGYSLLITSVACLAYTTRSFYSPCLGLRTLSCVQSITEKGTEAQSYGHTLNELLHWFVSKPSSWQTFKLPFYIVSENKHSEIKNQ